MSILEKRVSKESFGEWMVVERRMGHNRGSGERRTIEVFAVLGGSRLRR